LKLSSHRYHQMPARNVGSVCSYGTNSWHMIPCTSKITSVSISHRSKLLYLLQTGRFHVVNCNDIWKKCEYLTFLLSVLVCIDANLIVSANQSAYQTEILAQFITNSIWCSTFPKSHTCHDATSWTLQDWKNILSRHKLRTLSKESSYLGLHCKPYINQ
jgi:hypothetical protein